MAAVLKGTTLKVSFASWAYTGFLAEDMTLSYPNGNVEVVRGENGETITKILMDPITKLDCTLVISSGSITPPIVGAILSLTPPTGSATSFYVESAETKFAAGATRLSLSLVKEGSMSYTT